MDQEKTLLKSSIIQGFGTLIVREFFLKVLSFIGQIFLARLLTPSDFGVYVIIVFIISLFNLFSDVGLSLALIQKKEEPTHDELSGIFWLKISLSLALIFLIWIIAPYMNIFYSAFDAENTTMVRVLSVTILLANIRAVPVSLLERKIKYNLISIIDIIGVTIYYFVSLTGAFFHLAVWSFILGAVIKEIIETIILYNIQPFRPRFILAKNRLKNMIKFGIYVQGNSLLSFIISSINPAIGGRLSGPLAVGLLDFAGSLVQVPNIISMNFARVSFAGFSRIQGEREILSKSINKSVSLLAIILYIFPVIFLGLGKDLIYFIYTEKWIAAVPALYWFSISVFFYPTITSLGQIILSIGKSKELFWHTLAIACFGIGSAVLLTNQFGFNGIAMANIIIYIGLYLSYTIILKNEKFIFSAIYILIPKLIAVICTLMLILFLNIILPSNLLILIIKLILGSIVYILLMFVFAKNDSVELFKLIQNLIQSKLK